MSEIMIVWAKTEALAQKKVSQLPRARVLRRGEFALIQAEDLDTGAALDSIDRRYCIVVELLD